MKDNAITILGSPWTIRFANGASDAVFANDPSCGGYTDVSCNAIVLRDAAERELDPCHAEDIDETTVHMLRHELIHAMLYECGLSANCDWASNEEMVDWLAIQFDKLCDLFDNAEDMLLDEPDDANESGDEQP